MKLALIATGALHALSLRLGPGLNGASRARLRAAGATSLSIWVAVLVCGRLLAFVAD